MRLWEYWCAVCVTSAEFKYTESRYAFSSMFCVGVFKQKHKQSSQHTKKAFRFGLFSIGFIFPFTKCLFSFIIVFFCTIQCLHHSQVIYENVNKCYSILYKFGLGLAVMELWWRWWWRFAVQSNKRRIKCTIFKAKTGYTHGSWNGASLKTFFK